MTTAARINELATELLACSTHDPARKHPDDSPAKGRWTVITAPTELVEKLRAALAAQVSPALPAGWHPVAYMLEGYEPSFMSAKNVRKAAKDSVWKTHPLVALYAAPLPKEPQP